MTHSRCWNSKSRLKTAREEGAGLGQITRAWNPDGTLRFDALNELRKRHPRDLYEWSWGNVYDRPDLQIRGVVLKLLDDFKVLRPYSKSDAQALKFADAAYNGGLGGLNKERRACVIKPGCDPGMWDGHVEHLCMKSKVALYGNRSACDINRYHVKDVFDVRTQKYKQFF